MKDRGSLVRTDETSLFVKMIYSSSTLCTSANNSMSQVKLDLVAETGVLVEHVARVAGAAGC